MIPMGLRPDLNWDAGIADGTDNADPRGFGPAVIGGESLSSTGCWENKV